jgi:hypothetical protein
MTQISRPFQIALAVLVLFVAVWFVALRGHSSSGAAAQQSTPAVSSPSSSSSSSSASAAKSPTASSDTPSSSSKAAAHNAKAAAHNAHHAAAPASGALKHAIVKAQRVVKHSARKASATHAAKAHPAPPAKATVTTANTQRSVEAELKHGNVVALLFWNPKGSVDGVVRHELQAVSRASRGGVVVHVARANEIGSFGSFTRAVQVYSTPTILLINTKGKTSDLTGLTDTFGIEQAVREVKQAK